MVARGGRSSESFVLFSLVVEDKKDLRVFFKPGEKQRGKEGGLGAVVMAPSENKRSGPLALWDTVMFLLVSSISCQHGSLHGANELGRWKKSAVLAGCS